MDELRIRVNGHYGGCIVNKGEWTLCGCIVNKGEWTLCGCIVNKGEWTSMWMYCE